MAKKKSRGPINFPAALEKSDIDVVSPVGLHWFICTGYIPLFYFMTSRGGSKKAPTKDPPVTSLRWCYRCHTAGFYEIDKAFSRCVILPPGVWEHFPKVTFALPLTHLLSDSWVSPSHRRMQISQHVKGRKISLAGIFFGVCVHHGFFCLPPDSAVSFLSVHR